MILLPWEMAESNSASFVELAKLVEGDSIVSVRYEYMGGHLVRPNVSTLAKDVHFAEMGVEVGLRHAGALYLSWMQGDQGEGMAIGVGSTGSFGLNVDVSVFSVEDVSGWPGRLDKVIHSIEMWRIYRRNLGSECTGVPWAFKIQFEAASPVVIALGQVKSEGHRLEYHPDDMLIIFDESMADSYRERVNARSL